MKSLALKSLCLLCIPCAFAVNGFALDREAFSFTNYDLQLQVDPEQHRLGVRGKITLRNDTAIPQEVAVLQISSSLGWRAIKADDKPVQFVTQPYASDIDHTGGLSEAIVTLPVAVTPHATIDLNIAYEGVIELDATRLTRIGTPEDLAKNSDWDRIAPDFTAVRGAGYVAWYPIATEAANLSEDDSLSEVLRRWNARESSSRMHVYIGVSRDDGERQELAVNQNACKLIDEQISRAVRFTADCTYDPLAEVTPLFVSGKYMEVERPNLIVYYSRGHDTSASSYADAAVRLVPLITDWFGQISGKVQIADLPDPDDTPFESGAFLLTSLDKSNSTQAGLATAHQLVHLSFLSFRPWIEEGLAHFAQALYLERENGSQIALDYMIAHRSSLSQVEGSPESKKDHENALVSTHNEETYRSKAMCVWWMLRDMIGDASLKKAIASYKPEQDNDASYMPRLIAAQTQRDLGWFFDDWVYHDHGLPDFRVDSAFSTKMPNNSYLLAVTIENLGSAGAEVPVIVKFAGGEVTKRLEVRAKAKATTRIETPAPAQDIIVNDGSVPESDTRNNSFKVPASDSSSH